MARSWRLRHACPGRFSLQPSVFTLLFTFSRVNFHAVAAVTQVYHCLDHTMTRITHSHRLVALAIASLFMAGASFAKDHGDEGHGKDKHKDKDKGHGKHAEVYEAEPHQAQPYAVQRQRLEIRPNSYFNDEQRTYARQYYSQNYGGGKNCPPGLAKKHNGCMPPGQAKNWSVGQPVPRGVTVYSVAPPVIRQLPPAPYGYRYARIGDDIVLVQQQNNLIVDIIVGLLG